MTLSLQLNLISKPDAPAVSSRNFMTAELALHG